MPPFAFAFPFACALTLGGRVARAEPAAPQVVATQPANSAVPVNRATASVRGFDVLVSAGWGTSTTKVVNVELAPYGASFGVDLGYTWSFGFRLGGYFSNSVGRSVFQHRDPLLGREYDFTADTSSLSGGVSIGWDVPFYSLLLRYTLGFGVSAMHWDFHDAPPIGAFYNLSNPNLGVHFAPGIALLWPHGLFEGGAGFDYLVQAQDTIPSGFLGKLLIGVRL